MFNTISPLGVPGHGPTQTAPCRFFRPSPQTAVPSTLSDSLVRKVTFRGRGGCLCRGSSAPGRTFTMGGVLSEYSSKYPAV